MNPDLIANIGYPPWCPSPDAEMVDVWDKYDLPLNGTFRLGEEVIVFEMLISRGPVPHHSWWRYTVVPPEDHAAVANPRFDTEAEFNAFLDSLFARGAGCVAYAVAEDHVITKTGTSEDVFKKATESKAAAINRPL